jgi:hypothetical protein
MDGGIGSLGLVDPWAGYRVKKKKNSKDITVKNVKLKEILNAIYILEKKEP